MKKMTWLILLLCAALLAPAAFAEEMGDTLLISSFPQVVDEIGLVPGSAVTVGTTTPMAGMFATELFGMNTADMDVRALLHGYSTIAYTRTQGIAFDSNVVANVETVRLPSGNRMYTFTLHGDLLYNNGARVTAQDYVFSLLLCASPTINQIGGTPLGLALIRGLNAYMGGSTEWLAGVRLLSDTQFTMEIESEYLPYFYGLGMLSVTPYPMAAIAPGCTIEDGDKGVRIVAAENAGAIAAEGFTPGQFDAAMLEKTLLDPETGYAHNPRITCGPYQLDSFDLTENVAVFTANPNYIGNYEGQCPHIETVEFRAVSTDTMFDQLASGEVDILNKVTGAAAITQGMALELRQTQYLRTGFSYLSFACEHGPTASVNVRQAIAMSFDKREFADAAVGARYGMAVYGYYGLGQWMFTQMYDEDAGIMVSDAVQDLEVPRDIAGAKALLAADGWTLNADGAEYADGVDAVRYRLEDGALVPLTIRFAKPEESRIADILAETIAEPFAQLGIGLEVTSLPFDALLQHYYRQVERGYDMMFLANNFTYIFDPYFDFHTGDAYQGMSNTTGLRDEALMQLALEMRETMPTEMHQYVLRWMAFQERFVELMPMVPLYSSAYYDFFRPEIEGYSITEHATWAGAVVYATVAEQE